LFRKGRFHVTCRFATSTDDSGRRPIFMKRSMFRTISLVYKRSVVSGRLICLWKSHMFTKR
jgi:hypothetical protein